MLTFFIHMVWGSSPLIPFVCRSPQMDQIMAILDGRIRYFSSLLDAVRTKSLKPEDLFLQFGQRNCEDIAKEYIVYNSLAKVFSNVKNIEHISDLYLHLVQKIIDKFSGASEKIYLNKIQKILCSIKGEDLSEVDFTEISTQSDRKKIQLAEKLTTSLEKTSDTLKNNLLKLNSVIMAPELKPELATIQKKLAALIELINSQNYPDSLRQSAMKHWEAYIHFCTTPQQKATMEWIFEPLRQVLMANDINSLKANVRKMQFYQKQLDQVKEYWEKYSEKVKRFQRLIDREELDRRQKLLRLEDKAFGILKSKFILRTSEIQDRIITDAFSKLIDSETETRDDLAQEFEDSLDKLYLEEFFPSLWQAYNQTKVEVQHRPQIVEEDVLPDCEPKINSFEFFKGTKLSELIDRLKQGASIPQNDIVKALETFGYLHLKQGSECTFQVWDPSGRIYLAFIHLKHGDDTVWTARDWRYKEIVAVLQRAGFLRGNV